MVRSSLPGLVVRPTHGYYSSFSCGQFKPEARLSIEDSYDGTSPCSYLPGPLESRITADSRYEVDMLRSAASKCVIAFTKNTACTAILCDMASNNQLIAAFFENFPNYLKVLAHNWLVLGDRRRAYK